MKPSRDFRGRKGFTLIEAALTTIIVCVGTVAILQLLASGTVNNIDAAELTTGINVAKNVREVAVQKSFAQVRAMNNTSHQPPWDSRSQPISDLPDWKQSVTVQSVNPDNLTKNITDAAPDSVRVSVSVTHNGKHVCDVYWYSFKP
jgi:type II secretory pathway pseudopilin PulG